MKYIIKKNRSNHYLDTKGNWSDNIMSYDLRFFYSEEEGKSELAQHQNCILFKILDIDEKFSTFFIKDRKTKYYLDVCDEFTCLSCKNEEIALFNSQKDAIEKCNSLGLDLNYVNIIFKSKNN